jgi:phage terminase large subunit GpA-like protein
MAKARPCPHCGTWYKPKFGGDEEQCFGCIIKVKIEDRKIQENRNGNQQD